MRAIILSQVLVALCFFLSPSLAGENKTIPYNWKNHPDIRRTGVQPDEPILIKSNGILFKVPAAYLKFWPKKNMVGRINQLDSTQKQTGGFNFIFWMPDKTPYPFKSWPARMVYHPSNDKIPIRFNVLVHNLRFQKADEYISPRKRSENIRNQIKYALEHRIKRHEYSEKRHGLKFHYFGKYPMKLSNSDDYFHLAETQPQISFECQKIVIRGKLQVCSGDVHFDDINLAFYVRFPKSALPRWKKIVSAVRTLALEWRVQTPK